MPTNPDNTIEGLWKALEAVADALDMPREDMLILLLKWALHRDAVLDTASRERLLTMLAGPWPGKRPAWTPQEALLRFGGSGRA